MKFVFTLVTICVLGPLCSLPVLGQVFQCPRVIPGSDFNYALFEGKWYEIGHYGNAGPAAWKDQCFCSTSNVVTDYLGIFEGDSIYSYECNLEGVNGDRIVMDTMLYNTGIAGQFVQDVRPDLPPHVLTVITLTNNYAIVYRCGAYDLGQMSYSAQILSRTPTMDITYEMILRRMILALGLNPENSEYVRIPHNKCRYTH